MERIQIMRRELHQIPELERRLPKTIAYIKQKLAPLSCSIFTPCTSALCAYFNFHKPTTIAFRSDMDALPISECNDIAYHSTHPHQMHACGHDAHMAILLEFAQRVHKQKQCAYNVLLVFQPAEETGGGAKDIVNSTVLSQYHVIAMFGFHVWPNLPSGTIASKKGAMMARSSEIDVTFYGKSAHIAQRERAHDALSAATFFHQRWITASAKWSKEECLLAFGLLKSGSVRNAISAQSILQGTLRSLDDAVFTNALTEMKRLGKEAAHTYGCRFDLHASKGYPLLSNDATLFERCQAQLSNLHELHEANLLSEDFAYYTQILPCVFFYLGIGPCPALHSDQFDFDDSILPVAVDTYLRLLQLS